MLLTLLLMHYNIKLKRKVIFSNITANRSVVEIYVRYRSVSGRGLGSMTIRAILPLVQHHEVVSHYFGAKPPVFILILPVACPYPAFYKYQAPFVEVFLCQFCQAAP